MASRHSRNLSHGKNLSKLNKVHSAANVTESRNHHRKKSSATDASHSPKSPGVAPKRNYSHVHLPKNTSHPNLRKNHSATILTSGRNGAPVTFKKPGLAPTPKPRDEDKKTGFFELGDQSSEEEEEGEWEDSNTQSPEFTRNNSKASTPARVATPNGDRAPLKPPDPNRPQRTSSPPPPLLTRKNLNRSAPNLRNGQVTSAAASGLHDPPLLNQHTRSSRAPPAMSTVSAHAAPHLLRSESSKSFTHIEHADADSMNASPEQSRSIAEGASSADKAVSHFLNNATPTSSKAPSRVEDPDEEGSINFMTHYKPQPSESPEKARVVHKPFFSNVPSRTQQRLDLERREAMRTPGGPTTPPPSSLTFAPSSLSLHSRSGSRGRGMPFVSGAKQQKLTYESGEKQLKVVRRFRNPMVESLRRLKEHNALPAGTGDVTPGKRPQSRRGPSTTGATVNGAPRSNLAVSRSLEDRQPSLVANREGSHGRSGGSVRFARQGSHDDLGITPGVGYDGVEEGEDGVSPEEALMRRIWESREVYEAGDIRS